MANYLTGAATYQDGRLVELAIFCTDEPDEEMQAKGLLYWPHVSDAQGVIDQLHKGDTLVADFKGGEVYAVEVVVVNGEETLEVVQQGQHADFASLRRLPNVSD